MDKVFHLVSKKTKIVNIRISRDYPDLHQSNRIKFVYENQPLGLLGSWMCRCKGWRQTTDMIITNYTLAMNIQPDSIQGNHPESLRLTRYDPYPRLTRTRHSQTSVSPQTQNKAPASNPIPEPQKIQLPNSRSCPKFLTIRKRQI